MVTTRSRAHKSPAPPRARGKSPARGRSKTPVARGKSPARRSKTPVARRASPHVRRSKSPVAGGAARRRVAKSDSAQRRSSRSPGASRQNKNKTDMENGAADRRRGTKPTSTAATTATTSSRLRRRDASGQGVAPPSGSGSHGLSSFPLPLLCLASVCSSVGIVLANKAIYRSGFRHTFFLTLTHFCTTLAVAWVRAARSGAGGAAGAVGGSRAGDKSRRVAKGVPWLRLVGQGAVNGASVGFMNLSIGHNSIGFYQASKLAIIPAVVALQALVVPGGTWPRPPVLAVLAAMLVGVGLVTVSDVSCNRLGSAYAAIAVLGTALSQTSIKLTMDDWGVSQAVFTKYQFVVAVPCMAVLVAIFEGPGGLVAARDLVAAAVAEGDTGGGEGGGGGGGGGGGRAAGDGSFEQQSARTVLALVVLTNLLGVAINMLQNELIHHTSPLTVQVLGHLKTCVLVVGGTLLFHEPVAGRAAAGLVLAFISMLVYSAVGKRR